MPDVGAVLRLPGGADEFRVCDPIGADGGHADPARHHLHAESPAVAVQEGLGRRIDIQILEGLKSRGGTDFQDAAAGSHEGKHCLGHIHGGAAVEIDHPIDVDPGDILIAADFAKSGGVDEQPHKGVFFCQKRRNLIDRGREREVERDGADWHADAFLQCLKPVATAGDDPDFIEGFLRVGINLTDEFLTEAAGGTGDNGNFLWIAAAGGRLPGRIHCRGGFRRIFAVSALRFRGGGSAGHVSGCAACSIRGGRFYGSRRRHGGGGAGDSLLRRMIRRNFEFGIFHDTHSFAAIIRRKGSLFPWFRVISPFRRSRNLPDIAAAVFREISFVQVLPCYYNDDRSHGNGT